MQTKKEQPQRLSAEELQELVLAAQHGNSDALATLVQELGALVGGVRKKLSSDYDTRGIDINTLSKEDILQAGYVGLIDAVRRYKPDKGAKFTTYAYKHIESAIRTQIAFEINRTGVKGSKQDKMAVSIDNDECSLVDSLVDDEPKATDIMIALEEQKHRAIQFQKAIDSLTEDEKRIIFIAYGIDTEQTSNTKKIAAELGLSEFDVELAINNAPKKMIKALEE